MSRPLPVLWLCGPPGVGKSSAAWLVYEQLAATTKAGHLDIDQLSLRFVPDGDVAQHRAKVANFAVMLDSFTAAGADIIVVSGVVDPHEVADFAALTPVTWVRLRSDHHVLERRFLGRGMSADLVPRVIENAERLEASTFAVSVIDTTQLDPAEVAERALRQAQDTLRAPR